MLKRASQSKDSKRLARKRALGVACVAIVLVVATTHARRSSASKPAPVKPAAGDQVGAAVRSNHADPTCVTPLRQRPARDNASAAQAVAIPAEPPRSDAAAGAVAEPVAAETAAGGSADYQAPEPPLSDEAVAAEPAQRGTPAGGAAAPGSGGREGGAPAPASGDDDARSADSGPPGPSASPAPPVDVPVVPDSAVVEAAVVHADGDDYAP